MSIQERDLILTRRRWLVLFASCAANIALGAFFTWSVFAGPMAERLNAFQGTNYSAADLAFVFSLANGVGFVAMIAAGAAEKKIGARLVILSGCVFFGLGYIISGLSKNMTMLMLGFSIVGGLANAFGYVCVVSNSVKFFPDKKGLAGGMITASFGISAVVLPPVADALIRGLGVSWAFAIFGIGIMLVSGISCLLISDCPDDFVPIGISEESKRSISFKRDYSPGQMLKSPLFYVISGLYFCGCGLGMMMMSETASAARSMIGMSTAAAALAVSALSLFNTFGRIAAGWVSDRFDCVATLGMELVMAGIGLALMYISGGNKSAALFCVGVSLVGLCFGAFVGIYPGLSFDEFGPSYNTLNYSLIFAGKAISGFAAQFIIQCSYSNYGSYRPAFLMAQGFVLLGLMLCFAYRHFSKVGVNTERGSL